MNLGIGTSGLPMPHCDVRLRTTTVHTIGMSAYLILGYKPNFRLYKIT